MNAETLRPGMPKSVPKLLVVEDEPTLRRTLRLTLSASGFDVAAMASGEEGIAAVKTSLPDAVLLDYNLPGITGVATCKKLRSYFPALHIVMLTVRDSEADIVGAFEAGANDYIRKPFHMSELTARLRAALRHKGQSEVPSDAVAIRGLEIDPLKRLVRKNGVRVRLTPKEFDLLSYLVKYAGRPIKHAQLLQAVWGSEYGSELEYLRTFVRQLRLKLEDDPARPTFVLTDPHFGYRFCELQDSSATLKEEDDVAG